MPEQTPSQKPAPGPESFRVVGLRLVFDDQEQSAPFSAEEIMLLGWLIKGSLCFQAQREGTKFSTLADAVRKMSVAIGPREACAMKEDEHPEAGVTWLPLSFGLTDLARALRAAGFGEPFVEKAILEYIRANPLDQGPSGSVHYVLSDEENEAVRQAGQHKENPMPEQERLPSPETELGRELCDIVKLMRALGAKEGDVRRAVLIRLGADVTLSPGL